MTRRTEWNCEVCGKAFLWPKHRATCSDGCHRMRLSELAVASSDGLAVLECAWCLAEFRVKNARMYCSKTCAGRHKSWCVAHGVLAEARMQREIDRDAARIGRTTKVVHCDSHGWRRSSDDGECMRCRESRVANARRHQKLGIDVNNQTCHKCGEAFAWRIKSSQCHECRKESFRIAKRLRQRRINVGADESVTRRAIWIRHNGRCAMCGKSTLMCDEAVALQATIDHITPISVGGMHTQDNTQLLCRECNCQRKVDVSRGQRWLVGFV